MLQRSRFLVLEKLWIMNLLRHQTSEKMVNFMWKEGVCVGIHHIDLLGWLPWKQEMSLRALWVCIFNSPGFLLLVVWLIFIEDDRSIDFSSYHTSWVLLTSALFFRDSSLPSEHLPHFLPLLRAVHLLTSPNYRKRHTWGNVRLWIAVSSSRGTHTPLPPGIWCAGFDRWSFFQLNKQKSGQFSRKTSDLHHTRTSDRLHSITFNMHDWISVISYWKLAIGSSIYDKVCHVYTWYLHLIISRQCSTWPSMYSFKRNTFLKKIDLKGLKQKVLAKGFIHITAYSGEEPPT